MMVKGKIKFILMGLLLLVSLTSFAAASSNILHVGGPWGPKTADPHVDGYSFQRLGVVETLVDVDQDAALVPGLATTWQVSGDQLTWTFTLRDGVVFHDGTPFTAAAMKKSLEDSLAKSKTFAKVPIKEIKASGNNIIEIILQSPFSGLPAYMAKGESCALSPDCIDQGDITRPIGTGPFKFESYTPREEIVTVKNPDYWGKVPSVDGVVYTSLPEAVTRSMMLQSGDIDISLINPPEITEKFQSMGGFTVKDQPIHRVRPMFYNCEEGPFTDKLVRQAMNYAIDRQALVTYVLEGVGSPAASLFPPEFFWANKDIQPFPYNPDQAKSLLAQAGWTDSNNDGILDKDGEKFSITLVTYPERAELPPMAEVIQDQLKKVGIEVELVVVDNDSSIALRNKGEFDIYLMGRGLLFVPDPDEVMMTDYHSSGTSGDGSGVYRWSNAEVDELIKKARGIIDPSARKSLYDRVQQIVVDESPVSYLNYYVNQDIYSDKVKGYRMHPTELSYHLEEVSLS